MFDVFVVKPLYSSQSQEVVGGAGERWWLGGRSCESQSKGVKCLSCLFMGNDGFDSLPKEQWEIRSEGHAPGWIGSGGGEVGRWGTTPQVCNDVLFFFFLPDESFHGSVDLRVCIFGGS